MMHAKAKSTVATIQTAKAAPLMVVLILDQLETGTLTKYHLSKAARLLGAAAMSQTSGELSQISVSACTATQEKRQQQVRSQVSSHRTD